MNPGFNCTGQMAGSVCGVVDERFANDVVNRVPRGGGVVVFDYLIIVVQYDLVAIICTFKCHKSTLSSAVP